MNAINKSEFRRFVSSRYPGGHWNHAAGTYIKGAREYRDDDLYAEAEAERDAWKNGCAEKPEWIKK